MRWAARCRRLAWAAAAAGFLLVGAWAVAGSQRSLGADRSPPEIRVAEGDEWMERVRRGEFWGSTQAPAAVERRSVPSERRPKARAARLPPPRSSGGDSPGSERGGSGSGSYRTVCVRLCDGYYWPMSFAAGRHRFDRDQQACQRQCSSPARLFVLRKPDDEMEVATDLEGNAYGELATAFLYRAEYKEECKCKPHPWEPEAVERHRVYALEQRRRKGDKAAAAELATLESAKGRGSGGAAMGTAPSAGGARRGPR